MELTNLDSMGIANDLSLSVSFKTVFQDISTFGVESNKSFFCIQNQFLEIIAEKLN